MRQELTFTDVQVYYLLEKNYHRVKENILFKNLSTLFINYDLHVN